MKTILSWLCFAADILTPRFITEDVAMERVGPGDGWDSFDIACSMADVQPGERFDGVAEVDSFTWLGFGTTYRIGNFRPWSTICRS